MIPYKKIIKFIKMNKFEKSLSFCRNTFFLFNKHKFGSLGKKSYIHKPQFVSGEKYIFIGNNSGVWNDARIEVIDKWKEQIFNPKLIIGNNVMIGQNLHLTVAECVEIEDDVLITGRVTITDITHLTDDKVKSVLQQDIKTKPVKIKEGAFIGMNATILPGVTVGKHAVVGANSVVTKDVPDFSTVVGIPASIIK